MSRCCTRTSAYRARSGILSASATLAPIGAILGLAGLATFGNPGAQPLPEPGPFGGLVAGALLCALLAAGARRRR